MTGVTIVRRIAASAETVFDAMTTPDGIAAWWGPDDGPVLSAEFDARVGGRFSVRFRTLDGVAHECSGEVLELARPTRLAMSWRWHGTEAEGTSRIDVTLRSIGDRCELTFVHDRLPDDDETVRGHEQGWNGALDKLERHLRGVTQGQR